MNLGLGNLKELKAHLLAEELRTDTSWDAQITAIGKGVAGAFESFCSRRFARVVGAQDEFSAVHAHVVLHRYPIETVTTVEYREGNFSSWLPMPELLASWGFESGLVVFVEEPGEFPARIRLTYTGGYWFDETEDGTGVAPSTAFHLPDDLKLAWLQQCRTLWGAFPKLGTPINQVSTAQVMQNFTPQVEETLRSYRRITL